MSSTTAALRLQSLQRRYTLERRQGLTLTTVAACGLLFASAGLTGAGLLHLSYGPLSASIYTIVLALTVTAWLVAIVLSGKALLSATDPYYPMADSPRGELVLNPAMALVPGPEPLLESWSSQYDQVAGDLAARNAERRLTMQVAGWAGTVGCFGIALLLALILTTRGAGSPTAPHGATAGSPAAAGAFDAAAGLEGFGGSYDRDGNCCRFEDRGVR